MGGRSYLIPWLPLRISSTRCQTSLVSLFSLYYCLTINVPPRQAFGKHFWLCICSTWSIQRVPLPVMRYYSHTYVTDPPVKVLFKGDLLNNTSMATTLLLSASVIRALMACQFFARTCSSVCGRWLFFLSKSWQCPLAEDRILCFELVAKKNDKWTLSYVKSSKADTDVPEEAAELIGQRRRWLNGSFAASVYALVNFWRLYQSGHNPFRLFMFHIQALVKMRSISRFNLSCFHSSTLSLCFSLGSPWQTFGWPSVSLSTSFLPKALSLARVS